MRGLAVLLGALLLANCGGSKSASTESTPTASPTFPATTPPAATTTSTTAPPPPATTKTAATTRTTATTSARALNVRVPARFTILTGGSVNPPTITVPAHFPVELIVISGDRRRHEAALGRRSLTVPARGQASTLIHGLRSGSYRLQVDGTPRGVLVIGGAPGP